jgi:hypothetical protein
MPLLNASVGVKQQQRKVFKLTNLLSAIEALAHQAVERSAVGSRVEQS